jgi:hypothetical protein
MGFNLSLSLKDCTNLRSIISNYLEICKRLIDETNNSIAYTNLLTFLDAAKQAGEFMSVINIGDFAGRSSNYSPLFSMMEIEAGEYIAEHESEFQEYLEKRKKREKNNYKIEQFESRYRKSSWAFDSIKYGIADLVRSNSIDEMTFAYHKAFKWHQMNNEEFTRWYVDSILSHFYLITDDLDKTIQLAESAEDSDGVDYLRQRYLHDQSIFSDGKPLIDLSDDHTESQHISLIEAVDTFKRDPRYKSRYPSSVPVRIYAINRDLMTREERRKSSIENMYSLTEIHEKDLIDFSGTEIYVEMPLPKLPGRERSYDQYWLSNGAQLVGVYSRKAVFPNET